MTGDEKFNALASEIQTLVIRQVELGNINPMDRFPPTNKWVPSGVKDGAAMMYLLALVKKLRKL